MVRVLLLVFSLSAAFAAEELIPTWYSVPEAHFVTVYLKGNPSSYKGCTVEQENSGFCQWVGHNDTLLDCRFVPDKCKSSLEYGDFYHVYIQGYDGKNREAWVPKNLVQAMDPEPSLTSHYSSGLCISCLFKKKPPVATYQDAQQKILEKAKKQKEEEDEYAATHLKDDGQCSCGDPNIPRTKKLAQLIQKLYPGKIRSPNLRQAKVQGCKAAVANFDKKCSLFCDASVSERTLYVESRIPKVMAAMPKDDIDSRVTPKLLLCIMKREDPTFNPTQISNFACEKGWTQFGLGQIVQKSAIDYWKYYDIDHNPKYADLKSKYGNAYNLFYALGDDVDLQIKMIVLVLSQKLKHYSLSAGLNHYDNDDIDGYVEFVKSCQEKIRHMNHTEIAGYFNPAEAKSGGINAKGKK